MTQLQERNGSGTHPDPARRARFTFDGRQLEGVEGESIASALFRNGERTLAWSMKYHRPRSVFCARGRCAMCHVEVDGEPGVRACVTPLADGMAIRRQDFRPIAAPLLTRLARRLPLPAGFYYRILTRPAPLRRMFMGMLRRMAGVGRISTGHEATPRRRAAAGPGALDGLSTRYDAVVVGAGVSGMEAALAASRAGARVLLVDEYAGPGGHAGGPLPDTDHARRRDELAAAVRASAVEAAFGCTAQGFYQPGTLLLAGSGATAARRVSAPSVVFATGANDLIPLFEDNDLPGVFGPRGLRLLLERDALVPGTRAAVFGTADTVPAVVALLDKHGIGVQAVLYAGDGPDVECPTVVRNARLRRAVGRDWVSSVTFHTDGATGGAVSCDLLCVALRGQPAFELPFQAGFRFAFAPDEGEYADDRVLYPTQKMVETETTRCFLAGEAAGITSWREKVEHAAEVGTAASGRR